MPIPFLLNALGQPGSGLVLTKDQLEGFAGNFPQQVGLGLGGFVCSQRSPFNFDLEKAQRQTTVATLSDMGEVATRLACARRPLLACTRSSLTRLYTWSSEDRVWKQ